MHNDPDVLAAIEAMRRDERVAASAGADPSDCGDPEHPGGAFCRDTTGLMTCYPPASAGDWQARDINGRYIGESAASAGADPEPRTEVGRKLVAHFQESANEPVTNDVEALRQWVLALETEARAQGGPSLDVERLASALSKVSWSPGGYIRADMYWPEKAKAVATEYARLGVAPEPEGKAGGR